MFGTLQSRYSSFNDFIWAFMDQDFQQVWGVANSVLFWCALLGEWGLPESAQTCRMIDSMIWMLQTDTVHSIERWIGHPCIPKRVFGPQSILLICQNNLLSLKPQQGCHILLVVDPSLWANSHLLDWEVSRPLDPAWRMWPKTQGTGHRCKVHHLVWYYVCCLELPAETKGHPSQLGCCHSCPNGSSTKLGRINRSIWLLLT